MAQTQAQYINMNLKRLANYINHLAVLNKKYKEAIERVCSKSISDKIIKDESTLKYEKKVKESYKKAKSLYNDLRRIAENYKWGINVSNDIQLFNTRLNMTRLPILKGGILRLEHSKQDGVPTGGASALQNVQDMYTRNINHEKEFEKKYENLAKQKLGEILIGDNYNPEFYILAKSTFGPDTAGMLDLAHEKRNDLSYTKDAIKLTNWNDPRVASDKEYLRGKVIKGFSYYDYDEDNVPGYFFKNYSEPSQRIANDKDFLEKIKESKNEILSNKKVSMGFPGYGPNTKSNLYYAFGKIDIRNGYIDKNGNLHVKVYDTYDFNPEEENKPLVMAGKNKMLEGELKPFFTIHDIIIPKETLKELWK